MLIKPGTAGKASCELQNMRNGVIQSKCTGASASGITFRPFFSFQASSTQSMAAGRQSLLIALVIVCTCSQLTLALSDNDVPIDKSDLLLAGNEDKRYAFNADLGKRSDDVLDELYQDDGLDEDKRIYGFRADLGKRRMGFNADLGKRFAAFNQDLGKRYYGFNNDLGKRYYGFNNDLGKRFSGFRADLGKRYMGFNTDLGKRYSSFRADLGKRLRDIDESHKRYSSFRADLGKRSTPDADLDKRFMFRQDLGKRAYSSFRADLGKRAMFRADLGKRFSDSSDEA